MLRRVALTVPCALLLAIVLAVVMALPAWASEAALLDGRVFSLLWVVPFAGVLLSIAVLPLWAPTLWHHYFGTIAALWALAFLGPFALEFGVWAAVDQLLHTALLEYIPFIILLAALFTVAGGVRVTGHFRGTPLVNTGLLAVGTGLASLMGTTGAAMLLIRPLLRANAQRYYRQHVVVFFIFLVANVGGALTPLGDPPLFLGFLKGVNFFWPTHHLLAPTVLAAVMLLGLFFLVDLLLHRREMALPSRSSLLTPPGHRQTSESESARFGIEGSVNLLLLLAIMGAVLLGGVWKSGITLEIRGTVVALESLVSNTALVGITLLSWHLTSHESRRANEFGWGPILEVAKLFAAIFITMIPPIAILRAGSEGALAPIVALVTDAQGQPVNAMYFWATGILSSFLDNAPTYLVFFNTAGGDAQALMHQMPLTLAAISCGAVFMGANSYIGNAPNFMIKAIAEERGVEMPSFFGYLLWSGGILLPLFLVMTVIFFR